MQLREIFFFSDCIKAQNPVSSGTFLFLFSFTSSMAKSPCVLSFSAPLISLTIFTWRKSPTNHANGVPDLVLWSHLPIHPQIPFSQAHSIPAASLCSQTLKKQKQQQHNQLARWTQVNLRVCCLKPQAKFVFHIFLWKIENRFWREYNGRFVFVFFSLLNMAVELVVGMWCQFNSESCFSFSWKPHRKFFEKLQTFFTVKPGDRENLFTPFTGKSCCVQLKQV